MSLRTPFRIGSAADTLRGLDRQSVDVKEEDGTVEHYADLEASP